jgi:hypothetical protein
VHNTSILLLGLQKDLNLPQLMTPEHMAAIIDDFVTTLVKLYSPVIKPPEQRRILQSKTIFNSVDPSAQINNAKVYSEEITDQLIRSNNNNQQSQVVYYSLLRSSFSDDREYYLTQISVVDNDEKIANFIFTCEPVAWTICSTMQNTLYTPKGYHSARQRRSIDFGTIFCITI